MPERTPRFRRRPHSSAAGRIAGGARSSRSRSTQLKPALRYEEINDPVGPFAGFEVGEDEGSVAAHPTSGARSILLMTRRSERVIPGPPLRGILSPAATSIT